MKLRTAVLALSVCLSGVCRAEDWPQFRGPRHDGISRETKVPLHWGTDQKVRLKVALPAAGNSSPIVAGDRVFVSCAANANGTRRGLYCFSRSDGKQLWSRVVGYDKPDPTHARNPYCGSTPAADDKRVVVWHGSAGVYCYDLEGNELWSRDLGEFRHIWGYASSPILYGDSIILNCGPGTRSFVTAVDAKTGRTLWQTNEPGGAEDRGPTGSWVGSWTTPVPLKLDGADQILVAQSHHVNAYEPTTGRIVWSCGPTGDLAYCDPMVGDGIVVAAAGYGSATVGFKPGGSGEIGKSAILWRVERNPQRIGTGVVFGNFLYMVSQPGVSCIDMKTGRELWKHHEAGQEFWASLVAAAGRLYVTSQAGTTLVFAPDEKEFRPLASNVLDEGSNSTIAISGGQIFLRTYTHLYCISE